MKITQLLSPHNYVLLQEVGALDKDDDKNPDCVRQTKAFAKSRLRFNPRDFQQLTFPFAGEEMTPTKACADWTS